MIRINDKDVDDVLDMIDVDNAGGPVYEYQGKLFNGIIESFDENGNRIDVAEFTDGHIGGVQREYFDNGKLRLEYYVYFAKPHGDWKEWNKQGKLIRHIVWKEGERVKTIVGK